MNKYHRVLVPERLDEKIEQLRQALEVWEGHAVSYSEMVVKLLEKAINGRQTTDR